MRVGIGFMPPDFSKATVEVLWKRAAAMCSNPKCNALTVAPNNTQGAVNIGSAAHIYGARPGAKRHRADLSTKQLSEITNGIWLCRNCHAIVDANESAYPAELLFSWRDQHERQLLDKLGKPLITSHAASAFQLISPLAYRIVLDRPFGWEYRLTAELLIVLLRKPLRQYQDLQDGLYTKSRRTIRVDEVIAWLTAHFEEAEHMIEPIKRLISIELAKSWGPPGLPGDANEILHVCRLIADATQRVVEWEESVHFAALPPSFRSLRSQMQGLLGSQIVKLEEIPARLNAWTDHAENNPGGPSQFEHTIVFQISDEWSERFAIELRRACAASGIPST